MKQYMRKVSAFLVDRLKLAQTGKTNRELHRNLEALSCGKKDAVRAYYIRKTELVLLTLLAGSLAAGAGYFAAAGQDRGISGRTLTRPDYGEGDRSDEVTARVAEWEQTMELTIQERKYTTQEQKELLRGAEEGLEQAILGENQSLDEIRYPLVFPETLMDGAVQAEWMISPWGLIDEDGTIAGAEDPEGTLAEIQGTLTCGEQESVCTLYARVYPPALSEEEELYQKVMKEAESADERDRYKEQVTLPAEVDGMDIAWTYPDDNPAGTILALTFLAAVCIYAGRDGMIRQRAADRRAQLQADYPDLMWKLAMLIEAGLTIRGAFTRICDQYRKQRAHRPRYLDLEIAGMCYEMQSGVPEAEAYERFGRRCGLPEYIRLGSFLSQNLKKGSRGLAGFLEQEAEASLEDRKNHARKLGEQAGTKMLFPMILMLGVVLVILMVPAFLSF